METPLANYSADHRFLLEAVSKAAGLVDPVAIDPNVFQYPLLWYAVRGELLPIDGVLVRDWTPGLRRGSPGICLGARLYTIEGIRFARVEFDFDHNTHTCGKSFLVVARADYRRLYRIAVRCRRDAEPPGRPPVLPAEQLHTLWQNTISYLDRDNLRRIREYGGRPKRGVLLTGPPGNGKTMACRWIWDECRRRHWEYRLVSPDAYRQARASCNPVEAVRQLFTLEKRGVIFLDDMDLALRDRETVGETDHQAVFLGALDGLTVKDGVVFVFTTNCSLDLIDRAFKRPGRIDLVLTIEPPTLDLRRVLMERWHPEIRAAIDAERAARETEGYSFAEIEELKNLLILRMMEVGGWDWEWAMNQFDLNRQDLAARRRPVGFSLAQTNGTH